MYNYFKVWELILNIYFVVGQKLTFRLKNETKYSNLEGSTELHSFCILWLYYSVLYGFLFLFFFVWNERFFCGRVPFYVVLKLFPCAVFYLGKWLVSKVLLVSWYMYRVEVAWSYTVPWCFMLMVYWHNLHQPFFFTLNCKVQELLDLYLQDF